MDTSYSLRNRTVSQIAESESHIPTNIQVPNIAAQQPSTSNKSALNYHALLPNFGGAESENLTYFFSQFKQVATLAGWPRETWQLILKSKLHSNALKILASDSLMQNETNFDKLELMLNNYFVKEKSMLQKQNDFHSIQQTPEMSVSQLAQNILAAATTYLNYNSDHTNTELVDQLILSRFSESLKPQIRWELLKFNPLTFKEAVQKASLLEDAYNKKSELINALGQNPDFENTGQTLAIQKENKSNEMPKQIAALNLENQIPNRCLACGKVGHLLSDCWHYKFLHKMYAENKNMTQNSGQNEYTQVQNRTQFQRPQRQNWNNANQTNCVPKFNYRDQSKNAGKPYNLRTNRNGENYRQRDRRKFHTQNNQTYYSNNFANPKPYPKRNSGN